MRGVATPPTKLACRARARASVSAMIYLLLLEVYRQKEREALWVRKALASDTHRSNIKGYPDRISTGNVPYLGPRREWKEKPHSVLRKEPSRAQPTDFYEVRGHRGASDSGRVSTDTLTYTTNTPIKMAKRTSSTHTAAFSAGSSGTLLDSKQYKGLLSLFCSFAAT